MLGTPKACLADVCPDPTLAQEPGSGQGSLSPPPGLGLFPGGGKRGAPTPLHAVPGQRLQPEGRARPLSGASCLQSSRMSWAEARDPHLYRPVAIAVLMRFLQQLTGITPVLVYLQPIFTSTAVLLVSPGRPPPPGTRSPRPGAPSPPPGALAPAHPHLAPAPTWPPLSPAWHPQLPHVGCVQVEAPGPVTDAVHTPVLRVTLARKAHGF